MTKDTFDKIGAMLFVLYIGFLFFLFWQAGVLLVVLIISHEGGHYILAKHYGLYRGIRFSGGLVSVELSEPFPNRWGYLSGVAGSLVGYPVGLVLFPYFPFYFYLVVALALGFLDLLVFFGYSRISLESVEQ